MVKILLLGATPTKNLGGPSLLIGACKILNTFIPEAEFTLLSYTRFPEQDSKKAEEYGVKLVNLLEGKRGAMLRWLLGAILSRLGLKLPLLLNDKILQECIKADIFVDILGITFTDFISGSLTGNMLGVNLWFLIGKLLKKPVVKFTSDMGPFKKKEVRYPAKFFLSKLDLIMARGAITQRYLQELDIRKHIYVYPDPAFILDPAPREQINEIIWREKLDKKPLIGIAVSRRIDQMLCGEDIESESKYSLLIAQVTDYLTEKLTASVVFIPNEMAGGYDDIYVARKVYKSVRSKSGVKLITTEYGAEELRGLIGECDMFISSRYHSVVAVTAMCVPCVVIGWGHKYIEIMEMLGQGDFVCDFETVDFDELQAKVDRLWHNREKIRAELALKIPLIKERVLSGGRLIKDLLDTFNCPHRG